MGAAPRHFYTERVPEQFNRDMLPWLRFLPPVEQVVVRHLTRGSILRAVQPPARPSASVNAVTLAARRHCMLW